MKKMAVIENGKIKKIYVSADPTLICCEENQYIKELGSSKAKIGDLIEVQMQGQSQKDYTYLWVGIASAATIGAALVYKLIGG